MQPIMEFESKIAGKNADVAIWPDRVEWSLEAMSFRNAGKAVATLGISALSKSGRGGGRQISSEMIPVKAISSVTSKIGGLTTTMITVVASGNTIEFNVPKGRAEQIKATLNDLILGRHPSQQQAAQALAPSAAPPPPPRRGPAPPPPGTPADWLDDPTGRAELRYWDGTRWTEHVATNDQQGTDPI